jgi:hypothetical protein
VALADTHLPLLQAIINRVPVTTNPLRAITPLHRTKINGSRVTGSSSIRTSLLPCRKKSWKTILDSRSFLLRARPS